MAAITVEGYNKERGMMNGPIPGQSLTSDPATPAPYEQAPKFTDIHDATMYLWEYVTEKERYTALMEAIDAGTPIMQIVETILFVEFQKGTMNPDLMLMAAEPLAYMLIALAERLDLDIDIDGEEDEEEEILGAKMPEERLEQLRKAAKNANFLPAGFITEDMATDMETLPEVPSLLDAQAPEQQEQEPQPSLMAPQEEEA